MSPKSMFGTRRTLAAIAVTIAVIGGCAVGIARLHNSSRAGSHRNVMVVLIDDATYEEIRVMRNVASLLTAQGTTFSHFYTTSPNCCPSRGGYYLGQYPHNSGVRDNIPPLGGANAFVEHQNESLGVWMQRAGYYTAQVGKYLNGWGNPEQPDNWKGGIAPQPGWDHWFVDIDPSTYHYYDYMVSDDGAQRSFGHRPQDYQTDVTGAETVSTIKRANDSGKPWFVTWSPMSPHVASRESTTSAGEVPNGLEAVASDKYKGLFANEPLPNSPSLIFGKEGLDSPDLKGKPKYVQDRVANFPAEKSLMKRAYDTELEALQTLDDWVANIYKTVQDLGQLDNTDIIFWSDNGLFHGEHDLVQKGMLYEEAAHVPLIIRGPEFPQGKIADQLTLNIDLPATILSIAGAKASIPLDGRNLGPVANDPTAAKNRAILLEYWFSYSNTKNKALRLGQWAYMEWSTGERELYDLKTDPFEMNNLAGDPTQTGVMDQLRPRMAGLSGCRGSSCEDSDLSRT